MEDFNKMQNWINIYLILILFLSLMISLLVKYGFLRRYKFDFIILIPLVFLCLIYVVFFFDLGEVSTDTVISIVPRNVIIGLGPLVVIFNLVFYSIYFFVLGIKKRKSISSKHLDWVKWKRIFGHP